MEYIKVRRCSLAQIHAVESSSGRSYPRHTHDTFGVGMIVNGAQRSWSGRGMVEACRGNLITCNPGEVHDGTPIGVSRAWKMLHFSAALVAQLSSDIANGAHVAVEFTSPVIAARGNIARAFESAYAVATRACSESGLIEERLLSLLAELVTTKLSETPRTSGIERARMLIDDNPAAAITLTTLANETGLSRFQLVRAFEKEIGLTPHAYIVQRRLCAARALMLRGVPLVDVATASGFADQSHFHRHFVRCYGMTPGSYAGAVG